MLATNAHGVFLAIQADARHLRDGGRIITIGQQHSRPDASRSERTRLLSSPRGVAINLAPRGITVTNIQRSHTDVSVAHAEMVNISCGFDASELRNVAGP